MLSVSKSSFRSDIFYKKLRRAYSCSQQRNAAHAPGKPLARAMSELVDKQYTKLSQIDHVLVRPGMYVGQMQPSVSETWLIDSDTNSFTRESITFSPALVKIFDEILVNAADNKQNDKKMSKIDVTVTETASGGLRISVKNDGKGIPIALHDAEKIYIPQLIFGNLLTGSNFDDEKSRVVGGRHGYGAKLTNIFSDFFEIETFDSKRKKLYTQNWQNNMSSVSTPIITNANATEKLSDYTKITFEPQMERFLATDEAGKNSSHKNDIIRNARRLFEKRAYDMAATLPGVNVTFNGEAIPITNFAAYVKMYSPQSLDSSVTSDLPDETLFDDADLFPSLLEMDEVKLNKNDGIVYAKVNARWEVAVMKSSGSFDSVSFVNNLATVKGGTHVNLVTEQIVKAAESAIGGKKQSVNASMIRNKLMVFVNCLVENPHFDSQSKDNLTSVQSVSIEDCKLSPKFLKEIIQRLDLIEDLLADVSMREKRKLMKAYTTKASRNTIVDVPKLQDAHQAGSSKSTDCTLVLTEGDSAMALAVAGLEVVGRQSFGVLPLKGKILNVRIASSSQLRDNKELVLLCKALGLDFEKTYANGIQGQGLRYGKVMIMCDQDNDGSHIKGLVINFFQHFWPNLLKIDGFLQQFVTPLVKVREILHSTNNNDDKKKKKKAEVVKSFYSLPEYEEWRASELAKGSNLKRQHVKYYKGLGTNTAEEGKSYFKDLPNHRKLFRWGPGDLDAIDLAFGKDRAKDRRAWLSKDYDSKIFICPSKTTVTYEEFVRKELIHFSFADNQRSLPSAIDGLKPSQRKVLYGCFMKKLDREVKVVQLAGYIAENTCYHHGEQSLYATIINMAQDYVGSNNVPLLTAAGQFGTRAQGGKDFASPRYIYTHLTPMARALYPEADDSLLDYLEEDGITVEPRFFIPIIPALLLNGCRGIGTGWSTAIPSYNILAVAEHVNMKVRGITPSIPLIPWGRGFLGEVLPSGSDYHTTGVVKRLSKTTVQISELPYGMWTEPYKAVLVQMCMSGRIKSFKEDHTSGSVLFKITALEESLDALEAVDGGLLSSFKLGSTISLGNMHAFDSRGVIRKYDRPEEIVDDYLPIRMDAYKKRKENLLKKISLEEAMSRNKCRFINEILSGSLDMLRVGGGGAVAEGDLVTSLKSRGYLSSAEMKQMYGPSITSLGANKLLSGETEDFDGIDSTADVDADADADVRNPVDIEQKGFMKIAEGSAYSPARTSYAYLLDLPIRSLTDVRSASLLRDAELAKQKLDTLKCRSESDLWLADLDSLVTTYNQQYD